MDKIEQQSIPVLYNDAREPVAIVLYFERHRIVYLLKEANEEEIVALFEKKDKIIKQDANKKN